MMSDKVFSERQLIHEIIVHANYSLSDQLDVVQDAIEKLDLIEELNDLNSKMEFNSHLLYNRVLGIAY